MATKVIMPQMGESIAEGTVVRWFKKVGDSVERDETLFEISTDKVDTEVPSPASGILTQILVQENQTVDVNTVVALIDGAAETAEPAPSVESAGRPTASLPRRSEKTGKVRTSPLVRRLAREHGIDLSLIRGTGEGGRISRKDIETYLARQGGAPRPSAPVAAPSAKPARGRPAPLAFEGPTKAVPMTPMRHQIAQHMVTSRRTSAHVTTVFEVEMTRIVETQSRFASEFERRNHLKLTFTPFIIRAVVEALREFPNLNASVDGENIVYHRDIHIGVAVALEDGLIVPIIRNAQDRSFLGVAGDLQNLAERARKKRLSVDEVQGGTFTVTNPGVFGGLFGTPIINQPQAAILGVGTIEKRPVIRDDSIAIRSMAYMALSFDHRIVDGAAADQFMARLKKTLENWQEPVVQAAEG